MTSHTLKITSRLSRWRTNVINLCTHSRSYQRSSCSLLQLKSERCLLRKLPQMRFQKLLLKLLGSELLQKVKNHLTSHQTKKVWILQHSLLTLKSSHVISPAQKSLSFLKYREKNHTNHCTLEHEAFLCQSFDFFLFSWLLKHTKQVSKQVPHFSNVKKAFSPKVLELGQLRYHVKTTHERCGSLVVLSQRRGRVTTLSG